MIESNRTMEQARRDFSSGRLTKAMLVRVPMSGTEWTIQVFGAKGDAGTLLEVKTLQPRIFANLDQAVQALEEIGLTFTQLKVE